MSRGAARWIRVLLCAGGVALAVWVIIQIIQVMLILWSLPIIFLFFAMARQILEDLTALAVRKLAYLGRRLKARIPRHVGVTPESPASASVKWTSASSS
ncbi:hypothetical protein EPN83_01750 [Patescibacteria group bacterium]|nr:MAG: hypothetical protein EPN83_01750 [Patescibacteria group bacterium]